MARQEQTRTETMTGSTGAPLFRRAWLPADGPRAALLLVHGLGEHSGRYDHVGAFLAARGVAVHSYDHLGHGRSGGRQGWIERFDHFLDDLALIHGAVVEAHPDQPLFLLGHSMGGLIVTAYLLERPLKPDYVILSGPAIVPLIDPNDRSIDPTRLSKDPDVWAAYLEDPLVLRERVQDDLLYRLADGISLLPGRASQIDRPILLIHGTDDRLCSHEGAKLYVDATAAPDRTTLLYPGGRHEMFNETNRDEVLSDLWHWIDARIGD